MKKRFYSILVFIGLVSFVLVYSCKKKDDPQPSATTPTVATAAASDYAGSWKVTETCPSSVTYTMTITASGSALTIKKLFNCFTVNATFSGNSFTIPTQTLSSSAVSTCGYPYTVSGSGTISGSSFTSLSFTYSVKDSGGSTSNCTSSATKL
jgi:hypothetical protein